MGSIVPLTFAYTLYEKYFILSLEKIIKNAVEITRKIRINDYGLWGKYSKSVSLRVMKLHKESLKNTEY